MTQIVKQDIPTNTSSHNDAQFIKGLHEVADRYDGFILDLYGVVHNGIEIFPGTLKCLSELKAAGKKVCLLSNTPKRGFESAQDILKMGVTEDLYTGIVTAGDSAHEKLKEYDGKKCWFAGTELFDALLEGINIEKQESPDGAEFVLNAITGLYKLPEDDIKAGLQRACDAGLPMVCSNPDLVVNIGDQQHICAGTYALYYENIGGTVSYHGKPHEPVYLEAQQILGITDKSKILAVGDALHTDIQGANKFGVDSIFNLVGIHWEEVQMDHAPGDVDHDKIKHIIDQQPHRPSYILGGFEW